MSDADALLWNIEKDPLLRSTITAIALFDRPPDRDRLVERVDEASRVIPRLVSAMPSTDLANLAGEFPMRLELRRRTLEIAEREN